MFKHHKSIENGFRIYKWCRLKETEQTKVDEDNWNWKLILIKSIWGEVQVKLIQDAMHMGRMAIEVKWRELKVSGGQGKLLIFWD